MVNAGAQGGTRVSEPGHDCLSEHGWLCLILTLLWSRLCQTVYYYVFACVCLCVTVSVVTGTTKSVHVCVCVLHTTVSVYESVHHDCDH